MFSRLVQAILCPRVIGIECESLGRLSISVRAAYYDKPSKHERRPIVAALILFIIQLFFNYFGVHRAAAFDFKSH